MRQFRRRNAIFLLVAATLPVAPAIAADLTIAVKNVTNAQGQLGVQLLTADGYADKAEALVAQLHPAVVPTTRIVLRNVSAGRYAVRVMQDRNGNGKLDTNFVGMPTEPYGFSNDAVGRLGPPAFDAASFTVGAGPVAVSVTLQ